MIDFILYRKNILVSVGQHFEVPTAFFNHCVNSVTQFLTKDHQTTGALHHIVLTWLHFVLSPKKHARLT
jgi:hypothetical protein